MLRISKEPRDPEGLIVLRYHDRWYLFLPIQAINDSNPIGKGVPLQNLAVVRYHCTHSTGT